MLQNNRKNKFINSLISVLIGSALILNASASSIHAQEEDLDEDHSEQDIVEEIKEKSEQKSLIDKLQENQNIKVFFNDKTRKELETKNTYVASLEGYEKIAENEFLELYLKKENLGIKVKNKKTNYIWEANSDRNDGDMNQTWQNYKESLVTFNYDEKGSTSRSAISSGSKIEIKKNADGFTADVRIRNEGIEFQVSAYLDGKSFVVELPFEKIKSTKDKIQIKEVSVMPFLGATYQNDIPGYFMIPDGVGALMRFGANSVVSQPYQAKIYGEDKSIDVAKVSGENLLPNKKLNLPIYGFVHGLGQDALLSVIESGYEFASLEAYPSGLATPYNFLAPKFTYKTNYFQATSKKGQGFTLTQRDANNFDIKLRVMVLDGEDADYVGMAKEYKQYLESADKLEKKAFAEISIPLLVKTFIAETKKSMLGDENIILTTDEDVLEIANDLKSLGIENLDLLIESWISGGSKDMVLNHNNPIIKPKSDWANLSKQLIDSGINVNYSAQYFKALPDSSSINPISDLALKINKDQINVRNNILGEKIRMTSPKVAKNSFINDKNVFEELNAVGINFLNINDELYADYAEKREVTRSESISILSEMMAENDKKTLISNPFDFLFKYTDEYLDMPIDNSGYMLFTDTVPFLPILLSGRIPMYTEDLNFNSADKTYVLKAIDYGLYPSYLLTKEDPVSLLNTHSNDIYTSKYETWKENISSNWNYMNGALGKVIGEEIVSRTILQENVSCTEYSNGVKIIVNYNLNPVEIEGHEVMAQDYLVIGE